MRKIDTAFGKIIGDESAPDGKVYLIPPVTLTRYLNYQTGEVKEYYEWNSKAAGVIKNVKPIG